MDYKLLNGDLLNQDVDVIVNAWNLNVIPWWLLIPQGVSGAIKKRAGFKPFFELPWKPIPLGGAVITSAGKLPIKAIIHVAGINLLWRATNESISNSVKNAISLAEEKGFSSIAFPIIGAGSGGFNKREALNIMKATLSQLSSTLQVYIIDFDNR